MAGRQQHRSGEGPEHGAEEGWPDRTWLIDGMNVIGSRPDGWWRDRPAAMRRLARQVGEWHHGDAAPVVVVFDGRPPGGNWEWPGIRTEFAPGGPGAADDRIVGLLDDLGPTTVVTSDAELARRARAKGAEVVGAGAFLRRLGPDDAG
ncbi:MAG TPA: NYN domain-containing protein [Acidimicrobiales bacterium]|nr:NYN domain-containing protein [Acidimicrobiales bacterium]